MAADGTDACQLLKIYNPEERDAGGMVDHIHAWRSQNYYPL